MNRLLWLPSFLKARLEQPDARAGASALPNPALRTRDVSRSLRAEREELRANEEGGRTSGPPSAETPIRVLHIEDDLSVVHAVGRLLRLNGYAVRSGATRIEVLSHFDIDGWRPDIILADYQLADGATSESIVAAVAERLGSKIPTIVLAATMEPLGRQACEAFAQRVLGKPADIDVLLRELEALFHKRV